MRKKFAVKFKFVYLIFLGLMVILAAAAIIYVRITLGEYRDSLPERVVEAQIETFRSAASDGTIWDKYPLSESETGKFEQDIDIKTFYAELFAAEGVTYSLKAGSATETEQTYNIVSGDITVAEVTLQKQSEDRTKIFILNIADWALKDVTLLIGTHSYTIDAPYDFIVTVNGIQLGVEDRDTVNGEASGYKIEGLFLPPSVSITDKDGQQAEYNISGSNIKTVLYDYSLTLPRTLKVTVDGALHTGEAISDEMIRHDIRCLTRPEVKISDLFGNTVSYEGGSSLDLTYFSFKAPGNYSITVDGRPVPDEARERVENVSLDNIRAFDPTVPEYYDYCVAVVKKDADMVIKDLFGNAVEYDREETSFDLTDSNGLADIPEEIAAEVDVLEIAKRWSLFMTLDLPGESYGFYNISKDLIKGSPSYEGARKWATSYDVNFVSIHYLGNPPFSEERVSNFTYLSENSFYVDIFLVKDMYVLYSLVPDTMENRLYFVKYDDTDDGVDNPVWKLADMS